MRSASMAENSGPLAIYEVPTEVASERNEFDSCCLNRVSHQTQSITATAIDPTSDDRHFDRSIEEIFQRLYCRFESCACQAFEAPSSSTVTPSDDNGGDKISVQRTDDCNSNSRCPASVVRRNHEPVGRCVSCRHAFIFHALSPQLRPGPDRRLLWPRIAELASLILYQKQAIPIRLKILLDHCLASRKDHCDWVNGNLLELLKWTLEDYHRGYVDKDYTGEPLDRWSMCSLSEEEAILNEFSQYALTRTIALNLMVANRSEPSAEHSDHDADADSNSMNGKPEFGIASCRLPAMAPFPPAYLQGLALRVLSHTAPDTAASTLVPGYNYQPSGFGQASSPSNSQVSPSSFSTSSSSISYQPETENGGCNSIPLSFSAYGRSASATDYLAPIANPSSESEGANSLPLHLPPPQDEAEDLSVVAARSTPNSAPITSTNDLELIKNIRGMRSRKKGHASNGNNLKRLNSALRPKNQIVRPLLTQLGTNPVTGKKRVQCMVCLGTFCDKGALKIHFSAVHLKEMHKCTREGCDMVFSSRRSRNRHSANSNPKLHTSSSSLTLAGGLGVRIRGGGGIRAQNILSPATASLGFRVISPPAAAEEYERMMEEFRRKDEEKRMVGSETTDNGFAVSNDDMQSRDGNGDSTMSSPLIVPDETSDHEGDDCGENGEHKDNIGDGHADAVNKQADSIRCAQESPTQQDVVDSGALKNCNARKRKSDRPIRIHASAYDSESYRESGRSTRESSQSPIDDGGCVTTNDMDCEPLDFSKSTLPTVPTTQSIVQSGVESVFINSLASFMPASAAWQRAAAALAFSSSASLPESILRQVSNKYGQIGPLGVSGKKQSGSGRECNLEGTFRGGSNSLGAVCEALTTPSHAFDSLVNSPTGFGSGIPMSSNTSGSPSLVHTSEPARELKASLTSNQRTSVPIPTSEKKNQCPTCLKIFQNQFSVKTHYQNVHMRIQHKCTVSGCNAQFPSKRSRDRHSQNQNLHRKLLSCSRGPTPVPVPAPFQPAVKKQSAAPSAVFPSAMAPEFGMVSGARLFGSSSSAFVPPPTSSVPVAFPPAAILGQLVAAALASYGKSASGAPLAPTFPIPLMPPVMPDRTIQGHPPALASVSDQEISGKKLAAKKSEPMPNRPRRPATKQQPYLNVSCTPSYSSGASGEAKTIA